MNIQLLPPSHTQIDDNPEKLTAAMCSDRCTFSVTSTADSERIKRSSSALLVTPIKLQYFMYTKFQQGCVQYDYVTQFWVMQSGCHLNPRLTHATSLSDRNARIATPREVQLCTQEYFTDGEVSERLDVALCLEQCIESRPAETNDVAHVVGKGTGCR